MKGAEMPLYRFLEGTGKQFVIPVYQRNYDWKLEQCKRLFDDLVSVHKDKRKRHFFGSIVSVFNDEVGKTEFSIIDGQQRITTVSLILLAMYNLLSKDIITIDNKKIKQQIYEEYLVDKYKTDDQKIKLKPVKDDKNAYTSLFGDKDDYMKTSNVVANYNYYYDRILKHELSIEQLFDAIHRLEIIEIRLTPPDDDPQLVFESLNSTGLDLSEGDKIRNFILMGLPYLMQDKLYYRYWNKIEEYTDYDVSSFIRHYLSIKQSKIPNIKKVYQSFKDYIDTKELDIEDVLCDLLLYSKNYFKLVHASTDIKELNSSIYRLARLETIVTYPYLLEIMRMYDEQKLDKLSLIEIFKFTETYIFRRIICNIAANSLNTVFTTLNKDVLKHENKCGYIESLKFVLFSKQAGARFPDDATFEHSLAFKDIYSMSSKNKWYLFE